MTPQEIYDSLNAEYERVCAQFWVADRVDYVLGEMNALAKALQLLLTVEEVDP